MNKIKLTHKDLQKNRFADLRAEICYYRNITEDTFNLEFTELGMNMIEYCTEGIEDKSGQRLKESYLESDLFWGAFTSNYYFLAESFLMKALKLARTKKSLSVNEIVSHHYCEFIKNLNNFKIDYIFLKEACDNASERRKVYEPNRK